MRAELLKNDFCFTDFQLKRQQINASGTNNADTQKQAECVCVSAGNEYTMKGLFFLTV